MNTPLISEFTYNASPEKIWKALTDKEQMKEWYFDINEWKPEVGNEFSFYEPGGNQKFLHRGQITELIPNERLQHTWYYPERSKGVSTVTWNLTPEGDQTKVTLTHEGLETFADGGADFDPKNFEGGWKDIMSRSLKEYVEK